MGGTAQCSRLTRGIVGISVTIVVVVGVIEVATAVAGVWAPPLLFLFVVPLVLMPSLAVWLWLGTNNKDFRGNPLIWTQNQNE